MARTVHRGRPVLDDQSRQPLSAAQQGDRDPDPARYVESDLAEDDELAILDEDKQTLTARIDRLDTGMAWAEDPPSRTRHIVANIEIEPGPAEAEITVHSNFIVYRSRGESE